MIKLDDYNYCIEGKFESKDEMKDARTNGFKGSNVSVLDEHVLIVARPAPRCALIWPVSVEFVELVECKVGRGSCLALAL